MSYDVWSQEDGVNGLSLTLCSSGLGAALGDTLGWLPTWATLSGTWRSLVRGLRNSPPASYPVRH